MKRKKITALFLAACLLAAALSGCGAKAKTDVNLSEVLSEIQTSAELPDGMRELTADDLASLYGIESSEITQFAGLVSDFGTLSDELVMLEASGDPEALREKLETRHQARANEMRDYLPDEYDKIEAGGVRVDGGYVALFISGDLDAVTEIYEEALAK